VTNLAKEFFVWTPWDMHVAVEVLQMVTSQTLAAETLHKLQ
jgi:hypothetical protein